MRKKKRNAPRNAPLLQIGGRFTEDTQKVLNVLDSAMQQALQMGRDAPAQEIAREIGRLGGVSNVSVTNSTFTG